MEQRIKLENGKYEIVINWQQGKFECLRHGEPWRNLTGDNLILALCQRVEELEDQLCAKSI